MSFPLRFGVAKDLLKHYAAAFAHAWQQRAQMEPAQRLPHERQFLPAALSLQDTPVSPLPRLVMWLLLCFAALATLWATLGKLDVVATAHGKVVPNDRTKTIQPFEVATVKAIHVTDGQPVQAGEVLIELDPSTAQADQDRLDGSLSAARLQVARGQAMLSAMDRGGPPRLIRPTGVDNTAFAEASVLLAGQVAEYDAKRHRLDAEASIREAELRSTKALVHKLEQTAPIAAKRAQDFENLVAQNFVSRHGYLEREQARIEQEADLAHLLGRAKEIEAALHEVRAKRAELLAETKRSVLASITEGQQNAAALQQDLLKASSRRQLMQLHAPVGGTVQQLAVHTVGGVVTPAQPLMVIVPRDKALEIEAFLENKDIGFVQPGQDAEVKIETFPYTKYGTLHAQVASVSHDAITDDKRGLIYSTRVKLAQSHIQVDGTDVALTPGMAVSVEIKTGKRRVIEYFLAPLMQTTNESLRER